MTRRSRPVEVRGDVVETMAVTVWGPDGLTRGAVHAVDWSQGMGLAGGAGHARVGIAAGASSPGTHYAGDLGPIQPFRKFRTGATTSVTGSLNVRDQALPSTGTMAALNPVLATMLRNQIGTVPGAGSGATTGAAAVVATPTGTATR